MSAANAAKCDSAFKQVILNRCYDALARVGFRRLRKETVDWPLTDGFNAWVGLNSGLYPDRLEINPFVGIHAVPIEKMWLGLEGKPYPGRYGPSATFAVHMGELDGGSNQPAFVFTPTQSEHFVSAELDRLACLYATIGVGFARTISDYQSLLSPLLKRAPMLGGFPQRVACCLFLMDRRDDANRFIHGLSSGDKGSLAGFIQPFLDQMRSENP